MCSFSLFFVLCSVHASISFHCNRTQHKVREKGTQLSSFPLFLFLIQLNTSEKEWSVKNAWFSWIEERKECVVVLFHLIHALHFVPFVIKWNRTKNTRRTNEEKWTALCSCSFAYFMLSLHSIINKQKTKSTGFRSLPFISIHFAFYL